MRRSDQSFHFAGGSLGGHCHVCAFFNGPDEEHDVLGPFIKDGLAAGGKAVHIVDPALRADHLRRLAADGIDVDRTTATGQLYICDWTKSYLREDRFEQDEMLSLVDRALQSNADAGYPHTALIGHMEWALLDRPGVEDLLEYETRVNHVLTKHYDPVICAYDLSKFSASVIMDVMRAHPMVIIGGVLEENPFFVPPDQLLRELSERGSAR
jgi:hypothetical protein